MMKKIDSNLNCPACQGSLSPRVLACDSCGIRVEGAFSQNEFSGLTAEMLHVLRIFVHCEGRIKDMEKALGVSYPTVKAQMALLKRALRMPDEAGADNAPPPAAGEAPLDVLAAMERGDVDYQEALRRLKTARDKK